ncbi:hypothetical protein IRY61_01695 [Candidatus Saccharibacteria bacterium]|jgi:hypothetical protein|nr:hypothetical protein [Candidatus Saccharibacteria bacterium]
MFGIGKSSGTTSDKLNVLVRTVVSDQAFGLAQKIWNENFRSAYTDEQTRKEILRFGYANPKCVVWLQRDQGRADAFELVVLWLDNQINEVFALTRGQTSGDEQRALALLNSMLATPSVVIT